MLSRDSLFKVCGVSLLVVSFFMGGLGLLSLVYLPSSVMEFNIFYSSSCTIKFTMVFDWMSYLFFSFVSFISASVIYYSGSYMEGDVNMERFIILVMLFVGSMFFLVFSLNLISVLLGWDGLGIVSYILVVYYQNEKSEAAGMITALSNRIGDAAILLGIGAMVETGSWEFLFYPTGGGLDYFLLVMVVLAAITKSAQMPFSAWLPAAMAAPTPVSALVHSSTLVTAGIYLLIRFNPLLMSFYLHNVLAMLGLLTTLMASISATYETDLKKVVALSTLSQLGFMVTTLSLGLYELAFFHLLTHAVFKALLFMCSGKILHSLGGQDMRSMGGLVLALPYTGACLNLSNLALCGFPFLAGFYSKDLFIESWFMMDWGSLVLCLAGLCVGLSTVYSIRFSYMSMFGFSNLAPLGSASDKDSIVTISMVGLSLLALVSGAGFYWLLLPSPVGILLPPLLKLLTLGSIPLGVLFGLLVSLSSVNPNGSLLIKVFKGVVGMWFLPWVSGQFISGAGLAKSFNLKSLDFGWWESWGGQGAYVMIMNGGAKVVEAQSGSVKIFLSVFGFSMVVVMMNYW
uniref:NADH-ubiquinone oxidoreductase chain 5 n=1 Tax=Bathynomus sp. YS-2016 TaxID=1863031 RepID=A0A1L2F0N2_9CRUS|nr:NADH dehydrogenase subunit 5 [Bathynomus sp. YS-2016]